MALILDANGNEPITQEVVSFSADEARLIRQYKRLLQAHGLGATHWCRTCQREDRDFEIRIQAGDASVTFECPHKKIEYRGQTY